MLIPRCTHLFQRAVREAVAADSQVRHPLIEFGQEDAQAAVLGGHLRQVDDGLTSQLLDQPGARYVLLRQGKQRRQVCGTKGMDTSTSDDFLWNSLSDNDSVEFLKSPGV